MTERPAPALPDEDQFSIVLDGPTGAEARIRSWSRYESGACECRERCHCP
jgi:hypothetical protein